MSGKGPKLLHVFSIGTNTRERMSMSRISRMVVWQLMHDVSKDFELGMECVLSLEEYLLFSWSSGGFWD
jgi:hypothetical protein